MKKAFIIALENNKKAFFLVILQSTLIIRKEMERR
jgi:hypothetical protein